MQGRSDDPKEARAQASARRRDLPDFVTFMLGTGVRIGEALAVRWCDLDLDGVPVVDGDELRAVRSSPSRVMSFVTAATACTGMPGRRRHRCGSCRSQGL